MIRRIPVTTEEVPTSLLSFKTIAPIRTRCEAFGGIVLSILGIQ